MLSTSFAAVAALVVALSGVVAAVPLDERDKSCEAARADLPTGTCAYSVPKRARSAPQDCGYGEQCAGCSVLSTVYNVDFAHDCDPDNQECIAGLMGSLVDPFRESRGADWQYVGGDPVPFDVAPSNRTLAGTVNVQGIGSDLTGLQRSLQCDNGAYATLDCTTCCPWYGPQPAPPPCTSCGDNNSSSSTTTTAVNATAQGDGTQQNGDAGVTGDATQQSGNKTATGDGTQQNGGDTATPAVESDQANADKSADNTGNSSTRSIRRSPDSVKLW